MKLIMSHRNRNFTIGKLFSYKDRQSLLQLSGVVYQLTCIYGQNYIEQTKDNLITRLSEQQTEQKIVYFCVTTTQFQLISSRKSKGK